MALAGQLAIEIVGNLKGLKASFNEAKQETKSFQKSLDNAGRKMRSIGTKMTTFVTGPAALMAGAIGKIGMDFEDALNQSIAIMGDVSDAMRQEMAQTAEEVASQLDVSNKEAAESYYYLASAGLDAKQSIEALPQVAEFATAGQFDMKEATDLLTDAQSALGLAVDDAQENMENMTKVSDTLVKANTIANASVQQFSEALTNDAAAALRSTNKSIEEGVAVLSVFADQGRKGQRAGRELARAMRYMRKAAQENKDALDKHNVSIYDGNGNMRNMADIVEDLETQLAGMSDKTKDAALAEMGFNAETQQVIKMLMGTSEQIRNYQKELENAGGTTQDVADKQMQSIKKQLGLVKDELVGVINQVFELAKPAIHDTLLPALRSMTDTLEDLVNWYKELNPFMQTFLNTVGLITTAMGPLLIILGSVASAISALIPIVSGLAGVFTGLTAPIAGVISVLGLMAYEFVKNWRESKNALKQIFDIIVAIFKQLVVNFKTQFVLIKERVSDLVTLWREFKNTFGVLMGMIGVTLENFALNVKLAFQNVKESIFNSLDNIFDKLSLLGNIPGPIGKKYRKMSESIEGAFEGTENSIDKTKESLKENDKEMNKLVDNLGNSLNNVKNAFGGLSDESKEKLKELAKEFDENNGKIRESSKSLIDSLDKVSESTVEDLKKMFKVAKELGLNFSDAVKNLLGGTEETISYAHSAGESAMIASNMSEETLATINEMQEKWSDKAYRATHGRIEILKAEKKAAIEQAKEKAKELNMSEENLNKVLAKINKYYQAKITEEQEKQSEERKNVKDNEMQYKYEKNKISYEKYKKYLQKRLKDYKKHSDKWLSIKDEIHNLEKPRSNWNKFLSDLKNKTKNVATEMKKIFSGIFSEITSEIDFGNVFNDLFSGDISGSLSNMFSGIIAKMKEDTKSEIEGIESTRDAELESLNEWYEAEKEKIEQESKTQKQKEKMLRELDQKHQKRKNDIETKYEKQKREIENEGFTGLINTINRTLSTAIKPLLPAFKNIFKALRPLAKPLGEILKLVGQMLIQIIKPMIPILLKVFNVFAQLLSILQPLIKPLMDILVLLADILISALKPLMPIIKIIATVLEIFLKALKPVIKIIRDVLVPVFNFFAKIIETVANGFISIINGVIGALNHIPFVDIGKVGKIDLSVDTNELGKSASQDLSKFSAPENNNESKSNKQTDKQTKFVQNLTINSAKELSPSETARKNEQAMRKMGVEMGLES